MRLIVEPAAECNLGPIDASGALRHGMDVLKPQDAAELLRRQSHFGFEDGQESPMTEPASPRDVADRVAGAVRAEVSEGKPYRRVQASICSESPNQRAFEVLEARA